ncbi:hypothetical protein [Pseudonocardia sp. GCM10023141]
MIQHRLVDAVQRPAADLPRLTAPAAEVVAATRAVWGEVPMALAPAFR